MTTFNLASERTRLGLTQTELAERLGCSLFSIGKWEKDISNMPVSMLAKASELFGCSTDYLIGKTDARQAAVAYGVEAASDTNT